MFSKLKEKIKIKLIKFLEVDRIEEEMNNGFKLVCNEIDDYSDGFTRKNLKQQEQINSLHRTLEEIVKVGVDVDIVGSRNNSWAVVCFNKGNAPIVKFIDLRGYNPHEMIDYLRRFDSGRYTIDTPMSRLMEDKSFYNWKEK